MNKKDAKQAGSLLARIEAVMPDQYIEPILARGIFEPTGHCMDEFEKKAYTVFRQLIGEIEQLQRDKAEGRILKNDLGKVEAECRVLSKKMHSVWNLLYTHISDRLEMWEHSFDMSKGWKIIIPDEDIERETSFVELEDSPELRELLEKLAKMIRENVGQSKTSLGICVCPGTDTIQ